MKVIFNDLEEMAIQDWGFVDNRLNIKTLVDTNLLRTFFTDEKKTRKMTIVGDDEKETIINGYTEFYSLEEYTGKIYGVNMYKPAETPEAQAYVLNDMLKLAKMQAQALDDTSALQVVNLYDDWQQDKDYKKGDKARHFGDIYINVCRIITLCQIGALMMRKVFGQRYYQGKTERLVNGNSQTHPIPTLKAIE